MIMFTQAGKTLLVVRGDTSKLLLLLLLPLLPRLWTFAPLHLSCSYLTLQETAGIQDILCPGRKEEGAVGGRASGSWGREGGEAALVREVEGERQCRERFHSVRLQ